MSGRKSGEDFSGMSLRGQRPRSTLQTVLSDGRNVWAELGRGNLNPTPKTIRNLDLSRQDPRTGYVQVGGRTYRGVDTGKANVLVPGDPSLTPQQFEERRRAMERVAFMVKNPLAGAAYGIAAAAGASPSVRDAALAAGGVFDAAILGSAPRGAPIRHGVKPPRSEALRYTDRPRQRYRELNERGQATGATATITKAEMGTGTQVNKRHRPPGWRGEGDIHNEGRGHLVAREFGGTGGRMPNLVTITQHPTNSSVMRGFETQVGKRVKSGEVMEYSVTPFYGPDMLRPEAILTTAFGSRGMPIARFFRNPPSPPKPRK